MYSIAASMLATVNLWVAIWAGTPRRANAAVGVAISVVPLSWFTVRLKKYCAVLLGDPLSLLMDIHRLSVWRCI